MWFSCSNSALNSSAIRTKSRHLVFHIFSLLRGCKVVLPAACDLRQMAGIFGFSFHLTGCLSTVFNLIYLAPYAENNRSLTLGCKSKYCLRNTYYATYMISWAFICINFLNIFPRVSLYYIINLIFVLIWFVRLACPYGDPCNNPCSVLKLQNKSL